MKSILVDDEVFLRMQEAFGEDMRDLKKGVEELFTTATRLQEDNNTLTGQLKLAEDTIKHLQAAANPTADRKPAEESGDHQPQGEVSKPEHGQQETNNKKDRAGKPGKPRPRKTKGGGKHK